MYRIHRCSRCQHEFVANPPDARTIASFYDGFSYFHEDRGHQGITALEADSEWQGYLGPRLGILERSGLLAHPGASMLELGCLEGKLLQALSVRGFDVHGCDINAPVVEAGRAAFGIDLRAGTLDTSGLASRKYDVVMAFHVVEHLDDPRRTLEACKRLLEPGGRVVIEVPCRDTDYGNTHHLQFFSEASLSWLFLDVFGNVELRRNQFTTKNGVTTASAYALGRLDLP